ncbi:MAG: peptidylprolyl isomerase [Spirochaetales bacterium]|nr:peptidylprolyl isomerase [Spirochaetales bacterium]
MPTSREQRRIQQKRSKEKKYAEVQKQRHPILYGISIVVLVVVVVTFIGSGIVGGIQQQPRYVFGTYKDKEIELLGGRTMSALNYFTQLLSNIPDDLESPDQRKQYWQYFYNVAVTHLIMIDEAERGMSMVSQDRIDEEIASSGIYKNKDGYFDEKKYTDTTDMEKSLIRKYIREQIIYSQYVQDKLFSQLMSKEEASFFKKMAGTQRKFSYVSFRYSDYPTEKVIEYGKNNVDKFRKIRVSRIFLSDAAEEEAQDLYNSLEMKVKSFEDLAREKSEDYFASSGGDMGYKYSYELRGFVETDEQLDQIMKLRKDEISLPIKRGEDWSIYKCSEEAVDPDFTEESMQTIVYDYIMQKQRNIIEDYTLTFATDFKKKAEETGFNEAARAVDQYPPSKTGYFPINYLEVFGNFPVKPESEDSPTITDAAYNKEFFTEAFSVSPGTVTEPILLSDQILVMQPEDEKEYSEEDWEAQNTTFSIMMQYNQEDPYFLQLSSTLKNIASSYGIPYQILLLRLNQQADDEGIPYSWMFNVFEYTYFDLDRMIQEKRAEHLEDHFNETYKTLTGY